MPYGDLVAQRVQRFASYADLDRYETTIEEREEYEPHLDGGHRGLRRRRLRARSCAEAEQEADVILWDGGNNDFSFYRPDLAIVVADPLRAGDELRYHPGETNLRMADVVVINKIDSADASEQLVTCGSTSPWSIRALVVEARRRSRWRAARSPAKRVVVVEDGPTLTHGDMTYGAGIVAARRFGAPSSSTLHRMRSAASGRPSTATRRSNRCCRQWATVTSRYASSRRH